MPLVSSGGCQCGTARTLACGRPSADCARRPVDRPLSSSAPPAAVLRAAGHRRRRSAQAPPWPSGLIAHAAVRVRRPAGSALSSSAPRGGRWRRSIGHSDSTRELRFGAGRRAAWADVGDRLQRSATRRATCRRSFHRRRTDPSRAGEPTQGWPRWANGPRGGVGGLSVSHRPRHRRAEAVAAIVALGRFVMPRGARVRRGRPGGRDGRRGPCRVVE